MTSTNTLSNWNVHVRISQNVYGALITKILNTVRFQISSIHEIVITHNMMRILHSPHKAFWT